MTLVKRTIAQFLACGLGRTVGCLGSLECVAHNESLLSPFTGSPWIDTDARHDDDDDDDLHHHGAGEAWRTTSTASSFYSSVHHHTVPSVHSVGGMSNIPASPLHTGGSTYYHRTEPAYHQVLHQLGR